MLRILVLGLTRLSHRHFPTPMCAINPHKALALRLHQVCLRVVEPAVDKVTVEAVAVADLITENQLMPSRKYKGSGKRRLKNQCKRTSPQASLNGGTPFHPWGIAFLVSYLTENRSLGSLFIPLGHRPPFSAAYV